MREKYCNGIVVLCNIRGSVAGIACYCHTTVDMFYSRCQKHLLNTRLFALWFYPPLQKFSAVKRRCLQFLEASPRRRSSHEWFSVPCGSRACTDSSKRVDRGALETATDTTGSQSRKKRVWVSLSLPPNTENSPILRCLNEHFNLLVGCHWSCVSFLFLLNVTFLLLFLKHCLAAFLGEVQCCVVCFCF